ncbi:MAG: glycosyltransferase [Candidatus Eisenbacteria bacterium]|jgi:glycosyltransferase involved in cell wall biosynthesis|nr:glycosyltransferase [Candidatus Eisenbacteria bacterium]
MRVLMLNHNVRGRSTYFRALGLARQLVRRGHQISLMTISPTARFHFDECDVDGVHLLETPDLLSGSLRTGWDPWDCLRRYQVGHHLGRFDVVHAFDNRPAVILPALALSRERGVPLCSDWADWWGGEGGIIHATRPWAVRTFFGWIETFFEEHFRASAAMLTVTSRALEGRAHALGIPPSRVHYLPSGADGERITPIEQLAARRRLDLPLEIPMIEYMGFVQYDIGLVLEAFAALRRRRRVLFLLVGPGSRKVADLARIHGLQMGRDLIVTGPQPAESMTWWLGAADVLLLPFQNTQYNIGRGPIKLGDYLASGRPMVTNAVGDIGTLLDSHAFALAANEDPQDFADKIAMLLESPALRQRLGQTARALAEGPLSWATFGARLEQLYESVVGSRPPLTPL